MKQDSRGCQVQPRKADQIPHFNTSRRQSSSTHVGRRFMLLSAGGRVGGRGEKVLGLSTDPLSSRWGPCRLRLTFSFLPKWLSHYQWLQLHRTYQRSESGRGPNLSCPGKALLTRGHHCAGWTLQCVRGRTGEVSGTLTSQNPIPQAHIFSDFNLHFACKTNLVEPW